MLEPKLKLFKELLFPKLLIKIEEWASKIAQNPKKSVRTATIGERIR
jgi:hypothetical protein